MSLPNVFRRARRYKEVYIRPHDYNIPVGLVRVPVSPAGKMPVRSFLVQSDLNNGGLINIGDGNVSLVNGIQLDPGRAWVFSVVGESLVSTMLPTLTNWADAIQSAREIAQAYRQDMEEKRICIDIADYFTVGDIAGPQNLRIFFTVSVQE